MVEHWPFCILDMALGAPCGIFSYSWSPMLVAIGSKHSICLTLSSPDEWCPRYSLDLVELCGLSESERSSEAIRPAYRVEVFQGRKWDVNSGRHVKCSVSV